MDNKGVFISYKTQSCFKKSNDHYRSAGRTFDVTTSGIDPWVQTKPVANYNPDSVFVVSFEYLAPNGPDDLEISHGTPFTVAKKAILGGLIAMATTYKNFKTLMRVSAVVWDESYNQVRFDFGKQAGQTLNVKNIVLREATAR